MSKHEEMRRKLQMIRDSLLELNPAWYALVTADAIKDVPDNDAEIYSPGDVSYALHKLIECVKHDESLIEKYLKQNREVA